MTSSDLLKPQSQSVRVRSIEPVSEGWSSVYQANHQVQYLQLQAEMDTLLLKLQTIERQRSMALSAR